MAAKLLQSLADDNPDLQKQIGCMTGIFQVFDRQPVLSNRRLRHRGLSPGEPRFANGSSERDIYHQQMAAEMNLSKALNEKQRISTESSRASFSSSCSSSLSSLDCGRTVQPEASSSDRIIFPNTPSRDSVLNQSSPPLPLGRQSLDLRGVVKDSMYRETRGLSVRTINKDESQGQTVKHKDSPRPLQLPMYADESHETGSKGKQILPADIKESLRVLAKLREAPWYYNESEVHERSSSYEARDGYWSTISKDAPRFSYDGRERNRFSFESRDTTKSIPKLKELPRLSLDSHEISTRGSNSDLRSKYLVKDSLNAIPSDENPCDSRKSSGTQKRPPSVVAKLMGLEALPDSTSTSYSQSSTMRGHPIESGESFTRSLKVNELSRPVRVPISPRSSMKEPISPRWRTNDLIMKPIPKSPIEPAPWKHVDGGRGSQKQASRTVKLPARTPAASPSVYSEIEKRLKDLEFKQSGKDLRALKQILEAMQAKGLLGTKKEEQDSSFEGQIDYEPKCNSPGQRPRLPSQLTQQTNQVNASTNMASGNCSRTYESPIVIMKPARLVQKSGLPAASMVQLDSLPGLRKIQNGGSADMRRGSMANRVKDQNLRNSSKDLASGDKKTSVRNARSVQSLPRTQQPTKESTTGAMKGSGSGSVSPRLQQKKLELEKRSRPPTPPSDLNKPRRQSSRQLKELSSPGGRQRLRSPKLQASDDQLSQISNESRTSSLQGDDESLQSDVSAILERKMETEVSSPEQPREVGDSGIQSARVAKYLVSGLLEKIPMSRLEDDQTWTDLAATAAAPEHPSPVSVLDFPAYREDELSPVKQTSNLHIAECAEDLNDHNGAKWNPMDSFASNNIGSSHRKKLQNVENLVKKLERLNSSHDEASTDYIASLCEKQNPDHRYISEILLASGLLLRDLSSGLATIQVHVSGHPINPELFSVLEQTKGKSLLVREENLPGKPLHSKPNLDKLHRKLIFDAVNEILIKKLDTVGPSTAPWVKSGKLAKKTLNAQKLLKELCMEIEQLQVRKPECDSEVEPDGLKTILWEDVMARSDSWTDFNAELSRLVLEVERSIFKELVDEVVLGEAAGLRAKMGKRRQLFAAK